MLTLREMELLCAEIKCKSKKRKNITVGEFEVTSNYVRQIHYRVKKKTQKGLKDLIFLAENYPEYLQDENVVEFLAAKLSHGTIRLEDRKRKPRSMRSKKYRSWVQMAGTLHAENGAPLRKPEIHNKVWLAFKMLQSVHEALSNLSFFNAMQVIRLVKEGEKIDVHFAILATEKGEIMALDKHSPSLSDIIKSENHALFKIGNANPENLKIIVLEYDNANHKKL